MVHTSWSFLSSLVEQALAKAIFNANKWQLLIGCLFFAILTSAGLAFPFLLDGIINHIGLQKTDNSVLVL